MSNFLSNLIQRSAEIQQDLRPRLPAMYEPIARTDSPITSSVGDMYFVQNTERNPIEPQTQTNDDSTGVFVDGLPMENKIQPTNDRWATHRVATAPMLEQSFRASHEVASSVSTPAIPLQVIQQSTYGLGSESNVKNVGPPLVLGAQESPPKVGWITNETVYATKEVRPQVEPSTAMPRGVVNKVQSILLSQKNQDLIKVVEVETREEKVPSIEPPSRSGEQQRSHVPQVHAPLLPKDRVDKTPPTVTVSIGRIEIRGGDNGSPIPSQPTAKPESRIMSLEQYLAMRSQGTLS